MKRVVTILLGLAALGFTGCGTVREVYKPARLGNLADNNIDHGIRLTLKPDKYRARIGEPITFTMIIRNVGDQPVLFPADPNLLLTWVYPDGRRDNLVKAFAPEPAKEPILLQPGEAKIEHSVVTTYYFDRGGIHEFRAFVKPNQQMTASAASWKGRSVSNGFGIFFEEN